MRQRLEEWGRQYSDKTSFGKYADIQAFRARLQEVPGNTDALRRLEWMYALASELLNTGRPEECILTLSNLNREISANRLSIAPRNRRDFRLLEALAYLRLGEEENCLQHHNPDSCLLPIRGGGQHMQRRGAQRAESLFLEMAAQRTNDLGARWLANVAAMTLGHYPEGLPTHLRIPPAIFDSDYALPRFPEIGARLGLAVDDLSGGTVVDDFDRDGLLDVLLTSWWATNQCHFFRNQGDGRFEERTIQAGLRGVTGGLNAMQTDYNNDGWPDVYIVRGAWLGEMGLQPDSLLKNNGDGTFADVTEEAGLLAFHPALSAVWFDADNDGWLDLFVGNETTNPQHPHPCQLFLNDRQGRFRECAVAAGVGLKAFVRGVTAGDYDNDGWPDLYVSCLDRLNILLRNDGPAATNRAPGVHFTDVTARARVGEPVASFPTWFFDYDNDGWLDLFVCGYGADPSTFSPSASVGHETLGHIVADKLGLPSPAEKPRFYRNTADGGFADVTRAVRLDRVLLTMGANFGDLDNDGFLDFYLGTGAPYFGSLIPNEMFRNHAGREFQNVTTAGGFGHLQKGHAIAFADLNNDGHQEVVLNVGGAFPGDNYYDAVFANPGNSNRWIGLQLAGRTSNRAAIGARVKVVIAQQGTTRAIHRVVGSGGSFGSSPLRVEIGLAQAERVERIEVWWPASASTNAWTGLEPQRFYELTEGDPKAVATARKRFDWPASE